MILRHWTILARIVGELDGVITALEWSEDIDPKKIETSLGKIKTEVEEVFEAERNKLEDVTEKTASKKPISVKGEKK